jgi:RNA polymerase-binding transcription factor DksA
VSAGFESARRRLEEERERLRRLRDDLAERVAEEEASGASELSHADQHPADAGSETERFEQDLSMLEQIEGELADVEDAYARIEAGTYGTCEVCGRPIAEERLEVLPAARRCTEHQLAAEARKGPVA